MPSMTNFVFSDNFTGKVGILVNQDIYPGQGYDITEDSKASYKSIVENGYVYADECGATIKYNDKTGRII